jgi:hypothetical protein
MVLPVDFWFQNFVRALFIISNTYRPGVDFTVEESAHAMQCFVVSVTKLLPDENFRKVFNEFISMNPTVIETLRTAVPDFFRVYPEYWTALTLRPSEWLIQCSQNNRSMFVWVYLLQVYVMQLYRNAGHNLQIPGLQQLREAYNPELLSKYDWGRALWFVIHICALYAPQPLTDSFRNYRDLLYCLQYLLPCPKCRAHLSENLGKIDLQSCAKSNDGLFRCSWELHNIVNTSLGKRLLSFEEAKSLYVPRSA